jgi:hypothetical protein
MPSAAHAGFKIRSVLDGTLYRARIERGDGSDFQVDGRRLKTWETPQYMDAQTAVGQAIYAIDSGKLRP